MADLQEFDTRADGPIAKAIKVYLRKGFSQRAILDHVTTSSNFIVAVRHNALATCDACSDPFYVVRKGKRFCSRACWISHIEKGPTP
jgi:hypothetical protein